MSVVRAALAAVPLYIGGRLVRLGCKLSGMDVRDTLTEVLEAPPAPPFRPDYDLIGYIEEPDRRDLR